MRTTTPPLRVSFNVIYNNSYKPTPPWIPKAQEEAIANGDLVITELQNIALQHGNTLLKVELILSYKHAFPNAPQKLFTSTCPNGVPSQVVHFTQIPSHQATDVITGLAHKFQISIHFEHDDFPQRTHEHHAHQPQQQSHHPHQCHDPPHLQKK